MSRQSMHPGSTVNQMNATALKERQVAQLATRLAEMGKRFEALDKQILIASEHAQHIRQLGGQHAAMFMASSRILTPEAGPDTQEEGPST
ncbi:hypothetical protein P389DRAFT_198179 [Cystobasidium minutum MCA 4210]|uniref:uncharacterized protein n=1 Tax=Cystobasidium minutum MCA 4210 TaxID=1397322 RepID=UPI0034D02142|eukprot:jgi/Rhomi1/198179/gm1.6393_g